MKRRQLSKQIELENQAIDRMMNIRNEKANTCRLKNKEKENRIWPRRDKMIQIEIEYGIVCFK